MAIFWLSILHYYTNISGFLAYLYIFKRKIYISLVDVLILGSLIFLSLILFLSGKTLLNIFIDLRFWWGWIIFYLIFKKFTFSNNFLKNTLVILCLIIIFEVLLVNIIVDPWLLPNYPTYEDGGSEYNKNYYRPYAFGHSPSVGSSLIVILIVLTKAKGWRFWLSVFCVFLFKSGTGALLLLIVVISRYFILFVKVIPLMTFIIITNLIFPSLFETILNELSQKISWAYTKEILDQKLVGFKNEFQLINNYELLFGDIYGGRGGDFGWMLFLFNNGIFGLFLMIFLILNKLNSYNAFALFIIVLATFHYPVIFYLPGQMLFGYILNMKNSEFINFKN